MFPVMFAEVLMKTLYSEATGKKLPLAILSLVSAVWGVFVWGGVELVWFCLVF